MRFILFFLIIFISIKAECQESYSDIVKPRLSFVTDKNDATDLNEWVIIHKDTFYSKYNTKHDLSYLDESLYSEDLYYYYEYLAFRFTDENSKKIHYIIQWAAPIVIYMDKELPESVRSQFEDFYSQIKGIENLKISFTSKLENANYYIKTTSKTIKGYNDDYTFTSEKEKQNHALTGGTYKLQIDDNNNKYYSCILTVNPSNKDEINLLKQLKQLFYMSLGNFFISESFDEESILSTKYDNDSKISELDLDILKVHYALIYDQKINSTTFKKLLELSKKKK